MSAYTYDYDEREHGSVWAVYNSRLAALRTVEPAEVSFHMVRLAIRALECALACAEHGLCTPQSEALVDWFCVVSPDALARITVGAPDQGQIKTLIAWHLIRAIRTRSRADLEAARATARVHGMDDAMEFIEEIEKNFTNEEDNVC